MVCQLRDSILYPNASRTARQITNYIYTYSTGAYESSSQSAEKSPTRLWNDTKTRHIRSLRREAGLSSSSSSSSSSSLPPLRTVIIDMTRVTHVDTTGMQAIADIRSMINDWAGPEAELRFVGLNERVKERFRRAESCFQDQAEAEAGERGARNGGYVVFDALQTALLSGSSSASPTQVDGGGGVKGA
ncbi:hypothetical protein BJX70DRAFT_401736 [Aspergillus crustosus]